MDDEAGSRISIHLPHNLLVLPPSAAIAGLLIGMSRGGSRARLRFLAENAHRPPTTVQGWYFYTKTRNYRVFYAACKTGARYALGLGGAVGAYCILDESVGWMRERIEEMAEHGSNRMGKGKGKGRATPQSFDHEQDHLQDRWSGWRRGAVHWEDGAIAGMLMGAGVGFANALPRQLFIRSLLIGSIMGGVTSMLQVAQAKVGRLKDEQERESAREQVRLGLETQSETADVDRRAQPSEPLRSATPADAGDDLNQSTGSGSSWTSWIPGFGK